MKVICVSGKAQHGKDTTAGFMKGVLESRGQRVLIAHFGDLLKYICKTFFGWDGQKDERGREILQYVGTDKIRTASPDYWVDFVVNILTVFKDEWDYVLLPDCRFPNEYEIFLHYGFNAVLLRVERPGFVSPLTTQQQAHCSETSMDAYPCDYTVINDGDLSDLRLDIDAVLDALEEKFKENTHANEDPV